MKVPHPAAVNVQYLSSLEAAMSVSSIPRLTYATSPLRGMSSEGLVNGGLRSHEIGNMGISHPALQFPTGERILLGGAE